MSAAAAIGCNSAPDGLSFAPVSGTIMVNGAPAAGVTVIFSPQPKEDSAVSGATSRGVTGPDGRYTLFTTSGTSRQAAVVGTHKVQLIGREAFDEESLKEATDTGETVTPFLFSSDQKSVGPFEVAAGGTDAADFSVDGVEVVE
ncbi:MAG: hypothetical protein AAF532_00045 [Planctomycetota bacterium]